jgi:hypothetical protein
MPGNATLIVNSATLFMDTDCCICYELDGIASRFWFAAGISPIPAAEPNFRGGTVQKM